MACRSIGGSPFTLRLVNIVPRHLINCSILLCIVVAVCGCRQQKGNQQEQGKKIAQRDRLQKKNGDKSPSNLIASARAKLRRGGLDQSIQDYRNAIESDAYQQSEWISEFVAVCVSENRLHDAK